MYIIVSNKKEFIKKEVYLFIIMQSHKIKLFRSVLMHYVN
jgi:hypothetical protein